MPARGDQMVATDSGKSRAKIAEKIGMPSPIVGGKMSDLHKIVNLPKMTMWIVVVVIVVEIPTGLLVGLSVVVIM